MTKNMLINLPKEDFESFKSILASCLDLTEGQKERLNNAERIECKGSL